MLNVNQDCSKTYKNVCVKMKKNPTFDTCCVVCMFDLPCLQQLFSVLVYTESVAVGFSS